LRHGGWQFCTDFYIPADLKSGLLSAQNIKTHKKNVGISGCENIFNFFLNTVIQIEGVHSKFLLL
jgi:hypothetical protein